MMPRVYAVAALAKFHQHQFLESNSAPKPGKRKKLISIGAAHQKHCYPMLENQPESLTNEAIS